MKKMTITKHHGFFGLFAVAFLVAAVASFAHFSVDGVTRQQAWYGLTKQFASNQSSENGLASASAENVRGVYLSEQASSTTQTYRLIQALAYNKVTQK